MMLRCFAWLPALVCAAPLALAQEAPKKEPQVIHVPLARNTEDLHQQMLDLVGKVELRLRQIDKLLADAGSAPRGAADAGQRTAEFVRRSQAEGQKVIEGIDKILELANTPHHPPGSGGS